MQGSPNWNWRIPEIHWTNLWSIFIYQIELVMTVQNETNLLLSTSAILRIDIHTYARAYYTRYISNIEEIQGVEREIAYCQTISAPRPGVVQQRPYSLFLLLSPSVYDRQSLFAPPKLAPGIYVRASKRERNNQNRRREREGERELKGS